MKMRLLRNITLGRDPETGEDIRGCPGDIVDLAELEREKKLTDNITAKEFAASLLYTRRGEPYEEGLISWIKDKVR
jgi:hypothetical protein